MRGIRIDKSSAGGAKIHSMFSYGNRKTLRSGLWLLADNRGFETAFPDWSTGLSMNSRNQTNQAARGCEHGKGVALSQRTFISLIALANQTLTL
jgi:hypothetical protein